MLTVYVKGKSQKDSMSLQNADTDESKVQVNMQLRVQDETSEPIKQMREEPLDKKVSKDDIL